MQKQKQLIVFTRYTAMGASSRCRYYDYVPYFERNQLKMVIRPFFPDEYLKHLYSGKGKSCFLFLLAFLRRLGQALHLKGDVLLEYELLPFAPYWLERLFLRHCRYTLNFDDNVWGKYASIPFLRNKFDRLVQNAAGVIVANDFLLEKVQKWNSRLLKIPTALDLTHYDFPHVEPEKLTILWIGTPVTYAFIEESADLWRNLAKELDFELVIVARKELEKRSLAGVAMRFCDWSPEAEKRELSRASLGVMPLPKTAFAAGKSAYKLIQYAASGIPAVASSVGENRLVLADGKTGFLAEDESSFAAAVKRLACDRELRLAMGLAARKRAKEFSLENWTERYRTFVSFSD